MDWATKSEEELASFLKMVAYLSRHISNFSISWELLLKLTKGRVQLERLIEQVPESINHKSTSPNTPTPTRWITCQLRWKPSGIKRKTVPEQGFQPVHYVSLILTETEKRYSQIVREALSAEFTTSRLQMYLLGAPKFQSATDHKPLYHCLTTQLPHSHHALGSWPWKCRILTSRQYTSPAILGW